MINWLKNRLAKEASADEVEQNIAPVGVRVDPPVAVRVKPADTYVAGYNVDEAELDTDDQHSATVNNIKTTGVDPYDTGIINLSETKKSVPEK